MDPDEIIAQLEKHGGMVNIAPVSKNEYRGERNGKAITCRIIHRGSSWQLVAADGVHTVPSNTYPWQLAIFDGLHWAELD
jgi:hypothetical protein